MKSLLVLLALGFLTVSCNESTTTTEVTDSSNVSSTVVVDSTAVSVDTVTVK